MTKIEELKERIQILKNEIDERNKRITLLEKKIEKNIKPLEERDIREFISMDREPKKGETIDK
jgi:uncharacterized small protein (DUF1192 family)